jgi:PhzF family phenazine biosynthesis protein
LNYYIVDVFSDRPFMGNPVAVVICTKELSDYEMQQIATWFNLSETTFVSDIDESKCRYKVRIFSPGGEMLGTACAVRRHVDYSANRIVQDCPLGLIEVRFDIETEGVHLKSPAPVLHSMNKSQEMQLTRILALSTQISKAAIIEIGPVWITALLQSSEEIENMQINLDAIKSFSDSLNATGIVLGAALPDMKTLKVRTFAPSVGVAEDPVCGSGNIALAMLRKQLVTETKDYIARQGQEVGRDGEVMLSYPGGADIELGGKTCITAIGKLGIS